MNVESHHAAGRAPGAAPRASSASILIVDDETTVRRVVERALHAVGYRETAQAESVESARRLIERDGPFALVLLDLRMPGQSGLALLEELAPRAPETVVIMVTAAQGLMTALDTLKMGACDYVVKPIDVEGLQLAVGRALKRRRQELERLGRREETERLVARRLGVLEKTRSALLKAICLMGEFRDTEGHAHLERIAHYSHLIARELAADSSYAPQVDEEFLWTIFECAPLHDIGKVAVPDGILLKPGKLTPEELSVVKKHAAVGRAICEGVRGQVGAEGGRLIEMAVEVTGGHHERWDGSGYPDGRRGAEIPLSARVVGLADLYDVCRSATVYRPEPIPPEKAAALVDGLSGAKFDPAVVRAFRRCRGAIEEIADQDALSPAP